MEIPLGELAALRVGLREARELLEQAYGVAHRELQAEIAAFLDRASKGKP
ncbi:MAG TPA: hypothetical protein VFS67_30725 [Polyangiaceae bacterium]|nr:hypothetical protein [Polyangiaceae bacterium]